MNDEVEESLVDDLLRRCLDEERKHDEEQQTSEQFERQARATLQQFVDDEARQPNDLSDYYEAIRLIRRLLGATEHRPGLLAKALGYRESKKDAEQRAMVRALEILHNDPLPTGSIGGWPPQGRGHRLRQDADACVLCGAARSAENGWRTDCPANPPHRVRSKETCAVAVAEAGRQVGITNAKGARIDSDAVLKMYNRWQKAGSPREREHERLLHNAQK